MRTERTPDISEKREQTYEEAIAALKMARKSSSRWGIHYDHTVYLQDISKRLYDENLILVALENKKCRQFKDIPVQFRTEKVYIAAMSSVNPCDVLKEIPQEERTKTIYLAALESCDGRVVFDIPAQLFLEYEFALHAVSCCPKYVDVILDKYRLSREDKAYTDKDMSLIREAMCPKERGRIAMERLKRAGSDKGNILRNRTFEQYCTEEYGYISAKHIYLVYQALSK